MKKETFSSKVGIEPLSTPFVGFQGSRGSRRKNVCWAGLSESIGECCTAPWRARAKEVKALAPPARIGYPLPEKASADLDGGATSV